MNEQTGESSLPNPEYRRLGELGKHLEDRITALLPGVSDLDKQIETEYEDDGDSRETTTYTYHGADKQIDLKRSEVQYTGQVEPAVEIQMEVTNEFSEGDKRIRRQTTFSVWKGWEDATEDEKKYPYEVTTATAYYDDNLATNPYALTNPWVLEQRRPPETFQFSPAGDARIPLPDPNVVALYADENTTPNNLVTQPTYASEAQRAAADAAHVRSLGGHLKTLLDDVEEMRLWNDMRNEHGPNT